MVSTLLVSCWAMVKKTKEKERRYHFEASLLVVVLSAVVLLDFDVRKANCPVRFHSLSPDGNIRVRD